jgi:eukaryotic-like serine/threonine-protein kinase
VTERTKKLESIFHAAMELASDEERRRYLDAACHGEPELRREVEELLIAAGAADPAFHAGREACRIPEAVLPAVLSEKTGDRIGRYKLLEKIGEGGMGVVYMAEQVEPVRRKVALKIIKLGLDTRQVVARFEAERQALAMMDHPHIAKVLDGGATETGRPYFVMELVQGVPITRFSEESQLSIQERLQLLIPVCQAIQHAHQKGIIHRDIKPSNVLVTTHNGAPHPLVIDFGVARALHQKLTGKTLFTQFGVMIGTPAYMSPEQAEMSKMDVDTRADIYSLGVLLYELLTGSTPFPQERMRSVAYGEMQRIIVEEEPEPPSTRLRRKAMVSSTTPPIARRQSPIETDLDWIVMKCLEKDRSRRYETATGLAADLQAHLRQEPVLARPPSRYYRFGKFVRRNKAAFTATAAVAAALVLGFASTLWMFLGERQAREQAQISERRATIEADRNIMVAHLLKNMLEGVGPSIARGRDPTLLREILDNTRRQLDNRSLAGQPLVEAELRHTLGHVYLAIGELPLAEGMHGIAMELRKRALGHQHPDVALSLISLADVLSRRGRFAGAEMFYQEALAVLPEDDAGFASALMGLAHVWAEQNRFAEAEQLQRRALELGQSLAANRVHVHLDNLYNSAGIVLDSQGRLAEAEAMLRQALDRARREGTSPNLAVGLKNLAHVLQRQERWEEAQDLQRQALEAARQIYGEDHRQFAEALCDLADFHTKQGELSQAENLYLQALAFFNESPDGGPAPEIPLLGRIQHHRADNLLRQERLSEARALAENALALYQRHPDWPGTERAHSLDVLGNVLNQQEDWTALAKLWRERLEEARGRFPADSLQLANTLAELTRVLLNANEFTQAETLARECLRIREQKTPDDWRTFNMRSFLGASLLGQKKYAQAEPLLLAGHEGMTMRQEAIPAAGKPRLRESFQRLAEFYQETGRPERAAEWKQKLAEFELQQAPVPASGKEAAGNE